MHPTLAVSHLRAPAGPPRARPAARCLLDVGEVPHLRADERDRLRTVTDRFGFRANDYYLSLIDWNDPGDPLRRLIMPDPEELGAFGTLDASDEASNTLLPGLQHKYADTALLLVTDQCSCFCRYCFRKRLFAESGDRETVRDFSSGLDYIASHHEIADVLLTGGDSLALPAVHLEALLSSLSRIPHLRTIRLGTKMPAFNPGRILDDDRLQRAIATAARFGKNVYVMTHFDHPREFTPVAREALTVLREAGATCLNQCPVTRGVNDDASVLRELLQVATDAGTPQYYLFQCRPTSGNAGFSVPITRVFSLISEARSRVSGLSRRARYCLSHASGKIEMVGLDDHRIYARYHRSKNPADEGRMLVLVRNDQATWLDQLEPA